MKKIIFVGAGATVAILVIGVVVAMLVDPELSNSNGGEPVAGGEPPVVVETPPEATPPDPGPANTVDATPPSGGANPPANDQVAAAAPTLIAGQTPPGDWTRDFPKTDFSIASIEFRSILSGGPPRDGIPAIDAPEFGTVGEGADYIADTEPVITLVQGGEAKAYPLSILMYHEIVNDEVGGVPVAVTFCPLCNSTLVFHAELDGQLLDFGTTGRLRNSDLVMYDRQTETWWQQFTGEGLIGTHTGRQLALLPSRVEAFSLFRERHPDGKVLKVPADIRRSYGTNPYHKYDQAGVDASEQDRPFLFRGELPQGIAPLAYVVAIDGRAWSLDKLRSEGRVETEDGLILEWTPGQNAVLDTSKISEGHDIGNVTVQRQQDGALVDVAYDVSFAFAFNAFRPDGQIIQ